MLKIAIVGRPNVGKSALFNRILKKRRSIVAEEEGVTTDRIYQEGDFFSQPFVLIDCGGIDPKSDSRFKKEILAQAMQAVEEADVLIMAADGKTGAVNLDKMVSSTLLKTKKPLCLAVNKVDDLDKQAEYLSSFYSLGIKNMVAVSALHGLNIAELLQTALELGKQPKAKAEEKEKPEARKVLKTAILGRANVGKSTLLNFLLKKNRSSVSDLPGTTRDSVDEFLEKDGKIYQLVDTAGIRRKNKEKSTVEKFARLRTQEAIENADVCLLMIDAKDGFTEQDKKILSLIQKKGKGCLVLVNKWDLIKNYRMEHAARALLAENPGLKVYPLLFISAQKGRNTEKILPLADMVKTSLETRISTGRLNQFVQKCMQNCHPPSIKGKRLRIYYLTQVKTCPPRFVLFVNHPSLMQKSYQKYLLGKLREAFVFLGAPLLFEIKAKPL